MWTRRGRRTGPSPGGSGPSDDQAREEPATAPAAWVEDLSTMARSSIIRASRLMIGLLLALPTAAILVRALGVRGYGILAFVLGVATSAGGLADLGMARGTTRMTAFDQDGEESPWPRIGARSVLVTGGLATLILWGVSPSLDPTMRTAMVVAAPIALFTALRAVMVAPLAARRRILLLEASSAGQTAAYSGVAIGVAVLGLASATRIAVLNTAAAAGILVVLYPAWRRVSRYASSPTRRQWTELVAFSTPLFVAGVSTTVLQRSDVVLLGLFRGPRATGIYAPVLRVADLSVLVLGVISGYVMPIATRMVARRDHHGLREVYVTMAKWGVVVAAPLLAVLLVAPTPVLVALFGPSYSGAGNVARVLAVGYAVNVLAGFNGIMLVALGRTREIGFTSLVAMVVNLALNAVLIPRWGALGAAAGTSTVYTGLNVVYSRLVARAAGMDVRRRDFGIVVGTVVATAVVGAGLLAALGWRGTLGGSLLVLALVGAAGLAAAILSATSEERQALESLLSFRATRDPRDARPPR